MRRFVRYALYACLCLVVLVVAFLAWLYFAPLPHYSVQRVTFLVRHTPQEVEHGRRLAGMICVGCHRDARTGTLSGKPIADLPSVFGRFYSANITRDPEHGIGRWTDADLAYLLRTGIRRDGRLAIVMPAFPRMADEDVRGLIAFLRSDDPLVRATARASVPPAPSLFGKAVAHFALKAHPYPPRPIAIPDKNDRVAFGRYIALDRVHCYDCHSADFTKQDVEHPERSAGFFGGNNKLLDINGDDIYSPNITFDPETGIGGWSEADFIRTVRTGIRPDRTMVRPPMTPFAEMTDEEAAAVFAYLKTVPILRNPRRMSPAMQRAAATATGGRATFQKYCVACHGEDGRAPYDLTQAGERYRADDQLKAWIRRADRIKPGTIMPAWEGIIREEEFDGLVTYVRTLGRAAGR